MGASSWKASGATDEPRKARLDGGRRLSSRRVATSGAAGRLWRSSMASWRKREVEMTVVFHQDVLESSCWTLPPFSRRRGPPRRGLGLSSFFPSADFHRLALRRRLASCFDQGHHEFLPLPRARSCLLEIIVFDIAAARHCPIGPTINITTNHHPLFQHMATSMDTGNEGSCRGIADQHAGF